MPQRNRFPWQQNFRKIPRPLLTKVRGFQDNAVLVAVVKKIPSSDIEEGKYRHLNIGVRQGEPEFPESVVPNPDVGTYSRTNLEGNYAWPVEGVLPSEGLC